MRVVAVIAIRNEMAHLGNLLSHLIREGVGYAILDNDSTDGSWELLEDPRFAGHLTRRERLPYRGSFELVRQLETKRDFMAGLEADWVIHLDADEILHSQVPGERLVDAVARVDAAGDTVMNFREAVFLPVDHDYVPDHPGHQPMQYYYPFGLERHHRMICWKASLDVENISGAGHVLTGEGIRIAEEDFVMRHYLFRDRDHARRKNIERAYSEEDLSRGWFGNRRGFKASDYDLPPRRMLRRLEDPADQVFDFTDSHGTHYWQWERPGPVRRLLDRLRG